MVEKIKGAFWESICSVSEKLAKEEDFLVVSHHDADGVTSCAIMVDLLTSLDKDADFMILKQLDSTTISKVEESPRKTIVFTDMGSGQLPLIKERAIRNFYIVDHHPPEEEYEKQVNPHFHGYDGGLEVSASGLAYLVAKSLGNTGMAHLAIVGAVGDMQDSDGKLHSLNRIIMEDGIKQGLIKVKQDLRLFGRQSRPLTQMLAYASDPVLPGLTGNESECAAFIEDLGIPLRTGERWRTYVDLKNEERQKLASALYIHLLDYNIPEYVIQGMIGEVYTLLKEGKRTELRDAKEYASLLNACGRQEQSEVGVRVCLGDRGAFWETARGILQMHRKALRDGITYLKEKGVEKDHTNFYYFDSDGGIGENIIGVIAGMAYGAGIIPSDRPILAFADDRDDPEMLKVSGRANWGLVRRGLHLGNALREESRKFGGEGGGHDIAAGARIPKSDKNEFLKNMDKKMGEQLNK
ncbi:MAG: DHH family phosphoesterase [Candidatus Altiarchaeota archaeon]|nr:DHH family phosphoesterase [Candidatus Altiarchaeota archaeon]